MRWVIEGPRRALVGIAAVLCTYAAAAWPHATSTGSGPAFPIKPHRYVVQFGPGTSADAGAFDPDHAGGRHPSTVKPALRCIATQPAAMQCELSKSASRRYARID
jgi:hypothetical protein